MRWESPALLLLLLAVPLALAFGRRATGRAPAVWWVRAPRTGTAPALLLRAFALLPWLALVLAVVAAARPQRGIAQSEIESRGVDIVMCLDLSRSMVTQDFRPQSRIDVAKETAAEFVRQRPHDRIGLVGFAGTAFTQCPLTLDHDALIELLGGLDIGQVEDGTAIGMGLANAVAGLRRSKTPSKVVVLLTDGQNNSGSIDPATGAELARAYNIRVHTVLIGPEDAGEATLRDISQRTGGTYFRATDPAALARIYGEIDRMERVVMRSIEYREYRDWGPWLMAAAAGLLLLFALGGATWAFRLP